MKRQLIELVLPHIRIVPLRVFAANEYPQILGGGARVLASFWRYFRGVPGFSLIDEVHGYL